jgi:predicted heme/steroid binding protein
MREGQFPRRYPELRRSSLWSERLHHGTFECGYDLKEAIDETGEGQTIAMSRERFF